MEELKEKKSEKVSVEELAALCAKVADERKAENIIQLEVRKFSSIADFYVLCTANTEPHIKAVSDRIVREVRERLNIRPISVEGTSGSQWVVIDLGAVIVHVLSPQMRELYQIEGLWGDAPRKDVVEILKKFAPRRKKTDEKQ